MKIRDFHGGSGVRGFGGSGEGYARVERCCYFNFVIKGVEKRK